MSAGEITRVATEAIRENTYGALVVNFANADMVGHTGRLVETVKAIQTLDGCFERLESACAHSGAALIMTADHGNAEQVRDPATGAPHTAHTTNPVPFVLCGDGSPQLRPDGTLADVAPTILALQGLPVPKEMTGRDLREP
jgi:2,3-bisphosphoglycerate-independent phosphoglycerate mutase